MCSALGLSGIISALGHQDNHWVFSLATVRYCLVSHHPLTTIDVFLEKWKWLFLDYGVTILILGTGSHHSS